LNNEKFADVQKEIKFKCSAIVVKNKNEMYSQMIQHRGE